jgi:hypothetical protein
MLYPRYVYSTRRTTFNVCVILITIRHILPYRLFMYLHPQGFCMSFFAYFKVLFREVVPMHYIYCTTYIEIAILRAY